MRLRHIVIGLAIGLLGVHSVARAIVIEETRNGVLYQVRGYVVSDDGKKLKIRVVAPDGKENVQEFDHAKVKILHQIDKGRLGRLARDNPKAYRDYAEELADQRGDPEARDLAMQLYLIAAYLDPQRFGPSSLRSMSTLASTPAEARQCRAMAFLLDPKGDASILMRDAVKPASVAKGQLEEFLKAMQSYRMGRMDDAKKAARLSGTEVFAAAPGMMTREAFEKRCTDAGCDKCKAARQVTCENCRGFKVINGAVCTTCNGKGTVDCATCSGMGFHQSVIDESLRTVLRAELWAIDQLTGRGAADKEGAGESKWSSILQARQTSPARPLSLESLLEGVDPRKCLYRNGKWVAPP